MESHHRETHVPDGPEPPTPQPDAGVGRWLRDLLAAIDAGPDPSDERFNDAAWNSPGYRYLLRAYLVWRRLVLASAEAPFVPARHRQQTRFLAEVVTEAAAPANTLIGNPAALRRVVATRGASVARGTVNFLDDVVRRGGRPAKMSPGAYRLGVNLAATPGRVVHRDDLMEVLQYEPRTTEVHRVPLLLIPAWVNKYYIYDLAPGRSLVEWAVREGFTVFAVSQRNPLPDHAGIGLDEYFQRVPLRALDVAREITGSPEAHLVGVCAGGVLAASLAARLKATGESGAASLTLLMSALDHPSPDEDANPWSEVEIKLLTGALSRRGGLVDADRISLLFDLLRSRETVWQPSISGWLLGKRPEPFDIWAWSEDGVDVPRALFEQTLRMSVDNTLARGRLRIGGRSINLADATQDAFVVAGVRDHIVPWQTVYRSARLLGGDVAFHLVPSGHVGGIISPPRPKAAYRTGPCPLPDDHSVWSASSVSRQESWWQAWTRWLALRSGPRVPAAAVGSSRHPAGVPAPGQHMRSR